MNKEALLLAEMADNTRELTRFYLSKLKTADVYNRGYARKYATDVQSM